jgi:uncharacterized protein (TIGR02466 family)
VHEVIPLFSAPLYYSTVDNNSLKSIKEIAETQVYRDDYKLSITDSDYLIDKLPMLKDNIIHHTNNFLYNVLDIREDFKYYFPDSWFVRVLPGGTGSLHNHNNSLFSGIVYIDTQENSGDLVFEKLDKASTPSITPEIPYKNNNIFNTLDYLVKPKKGDILIFPSYLYHQITINLSSNVRYSFAFNILPIEYKCDKPGMKVIKEKY